MRLLTPQKVARKVPPKDSEEVKKVLSKKEPESQVAWLAYEREMQSKLKTVEDAVALLEKTEQEFNQFVNGLRESTKQKIVELEGKLQTIEKERQRVQQPLSEEKKELQVLIGSIKQERIEQSKQSEKLEEQSSWIQKNISDLAAYMDSLRQFEEELPQKKGEVDSGISQARKEIDTFQRVVSSFSSSAKSILQEIEGEKKRVSQDNIAIASSKEWFIKNQVVLKGWQVELEKKAKELVPNAGKELGRLLADKKSLEDSLPALAGKAHELSQSKEEFVSLLTDLSSERLRLENFKQEVEEANKRFSENVVQAQRTVLEQTQWISVLLEGIKQSLEVANKTRKEVQEVSESVSKSREIMQIQREESDEVVKEANRLVGDAKNTLSKIHSAMETSEEKFASLQSIASSAKEVVERVSLYAQGVSEKANDSDKKLIEKSDEVLRILKKVENEYSNIQKTVELNNLKVASAESVVEKTEERFKVWEKRLEDRELVLKTAFQEAREKGIY